VAEPCFNPDDIASLIILAGRDQRFGVSPLGHLDLACRRKDLKLLAVKPIGLRAEDVIHNLHIFIGHFCLTYISVPELVTGSHRQ